MSTLFQLRSFLTYWLDAVDEHSLHSPFFYDFCTKVVKGKSARDTFAAVENARVKMLRDQRSVTVDDYGKGSSHFHGSNRIIGDIARTSLSRPRFSELYAR